MDTIKNMLANYVMHKYLPFTYIAQGWAKLQGYRTQIFAVLWIVCYELGKNHVGLFNDPQFTNKVLEYLAGGASITFLEKLKGWLPAVESGINSVQQGQPK